MNDQQEPRKGTSWFGRSDLPVDDQLKLKRNLVRRVVSYLAAFYLFLGGFLLVLFAFWLIEGDTVPSGFTAAKDIYMSILPVASGVIAYWFASREGLAEPTIDKSPDDTEGAN